MAKTTISHELAAQYPEFKGRAGETVDAAEVQQVVSSHEKETAEETAERTSTEAPKPAKGKGKSTRKGK